VCACPAAAALSAASVAADVGAGRGSAVPALVLDAWAGSADLNVFTACVADREGCAGLVAGVEGCAGAGADSDGIWAERG